MQNNVFTGDNNKFYTYLKKNIQNATGIDIIVSFLMESGVNLILDDLKYYFAPKDFDYFDLYLLFDY